LGEAEDATATVVFVKRSQRGKTVTFRNEGLCPICEKTTEFSSDYDWFRDHYKCSGCGSIPRERALMAAIELYYPEWRTLNVHESSPCGRGVSVKMSGECPGYTESQFYPDFPLGAIHPEGFRCEDLENLTFPSRFFDLMITQDVMEHVLNPTRAFAEIARTLKPGGAHAFTVPLVNKGRSSEIRAKRDKDGSIVYLQPPEYHENPVSAEGALVSMHWGYDICEFIFKASGLYTTIVYIDDISRGIRAELIEVLVSKKLGG
jgi:SAM-dependent methyltransferase